MKLKSVTLSGFRAFAATESIDLDADAVIISGANGRGKTSLFDSILWALTGSVERLHGDAADVVSRYSLSGEARVELQLYGSDDRSVTIIRRYDGHDHLSFETADETLRGSAAETALIDLLWPEAKAALEPRDALSRSLTRAMYLQQDVVREFIEADDEEKRFNVVSELVGVGRVTELQRQLEIGRTAWSRATNRFDDELKPLRSQIASMDERLRRLGGGAGQTPDLAEFDSWTTEAQRLVGLEPGALSGGGSAIDSALTALQAAQRTHDRSISSLQGLLAHLATDVPEPVELEPLRAQVHASEAIVADLSFQLQTAQESVAAELRRQAEIRDQTESMQALARLALRHLGERCPVCDQTYDAEATRERLVRQISQDDAASSEPPPPSTGNIATQLEAAQRQIAADEAALRAAERSESVRSSWVSTRESLAAVSGLADSVSLVADAERNLLELQQTNAQLLEHQRSGERLSLQLARLAEQGQRSEIETQLTTMRADLGDREAEREQRAATGDLANKILAGLRLASTRIVSDELDRIGPLLQRTYASVEPHPSFRAARFLTSIRGGHGRVWTAILDDTAEKEEREPSIVLSSSQLNVLAASTFLSLNLAIDTLPLQVVALDDPLQSLDTVNLLGLADLLRRVRATRQVLVSTHDDRLSDLLCRKLRPVSASGRTRVIRFEAWTREGPVVEQFDVPADVTPLKLVAAV